LYYLFDFGDEWWHELTVLKTQSAAESEKYLKIARKLGSLLTSTLTRKKRMSFVYGNCVFH
jgi:hypothetical protein